MPKSKKETYFTPDTIEIKSLEIQKWLEPYRRKHGFVHKPGHSALLVLDMQAYFLNEASHAFIPGSKAIIPGVNALIQAFNDRNLPIFFSRHINTVQNAGLMASWWRELIVEENPLSQIDPRINQAIGTVIKKSSYDAFFNTALESLLQEQGVRQVVICGVMTHLCCETTARSAFMRGFEVFFTIDGTATYNEAFYRAALLNLSHGFATPVLVNEIIAMLKGDDEH